MSTYKKVRVWNARCGNNPVPAGTEEYYANVLNQLKRVAEELNETIEAAHQKDLLGVIDGGLDLDVTVAGLNYLVGADYDAGIKLVLDNNELKYTKSKKKAANWVFFHEDNGVDVYLQETIIGSQTYYCVKRNEDGKILKYGNFPKVDLIPTAPKLELEAYILVADEGAITEEVMDYSSENGLDVVLLDQMGEGDDTNILAKVLTSADSSAAFLFVANGQLHSAQAFTADGPTYEETK